MSRWFADECGKYVPKLELIDVVRCMLDVGENIEEYVFLTIVCCFLLCCFVALFFVAIAISFDRAVAMRHRLLRLFLEDRCKIKVAFFSFLK